MTNPTIFTISTLQNPLICGKVRQSSPPTQLSSVFVLRTRQSPSFAGWNSVIYSRFVYTRDSRTTLSTWLDVPILASITPYCCPVTDIFFSCFPFFCKYFLRILKAGYFSACVHEKAAIADSVLLGYFEYPLYLPSSSLSHFYIHRKITFSLTVHII